MFGCIGFDMCNNYVVIVRVVGYYHVRVGGGGCDSVYFRTRFAFIYLEICVTIDNNSRRTDFIRHNETRTQYSKFKPDSN